MCVFNAILCIFSLGLRDSISHYVGSLVRRSVHHLLFRRFVSGFRMTAPAQSNATDAVTFSIGILNTPLLDRNVAKRTFVTRKIDEEST